MAQGRQKELIELQEKLSEDEAMDELPSLEELEQVQKLYKHATKPYKAESISDEALKKIFENFAKEFGEDNIKNNALHFPDDKDNKKADDFFRRQAKEGYAFLFKQSGCDNYAFSDGKHYIMGSKADVISYCKQNSINPPSAFNVNPSAEPEISSPSIR